MPLNGLGLYAVWKQEGATAKTDSNGKTYYLPTGFTYLEGTVATGLVIQDSNGNQFVWVPVASENLGYSKMTDNLGTAASQTTDDTLPSGITSEQTQITKYGGFYIARYEAGIPTSLSTAISTTTDTARNVSGVPVSKQNQVPWTYIDYTHAKANSERMYSNSYVQSGLITGTQWDVIMKWLIKSGYNVNTDSAGWGNHANSSFSSTAMDSSSSAGNSWTSGTTTSSTYALFKTGTSSGTKAKNIYDLAGNVWEYTSEVFGDVRINRSGAYDGHSTIYPASYRLGMGAYTVTWFGRTHGFRVVLYMK
jgi:hypothetical protein